MMGLDQIGEAEGLRPEKGRALRPGQSLFHHTKGLAALRVLAGFMSVALQGDVRATGLNPRGQIALVFRRAAAMSQRRSWLSHKAVIVGRRGARSRFGQVLICAPQHQRMVSR